MASQISGLILAATLAMSHASVTPWKTFDVPHRFTAQFPRTWVRLGISKDRLQILSSAGGAEGVIIGRGQGQITVMEAEDESGASLQATIARFEEQARVIAQRNIPLTVSGGCDVLREIVSVEGAVPARDTPGPVPQIVNTDLFCVIGHRSFVVLLRNWKDDPRESNYRRVALRMAESIRIGR